MQRLHHDLGRHGARNFASEAQVKRPKLLHRSTRSLAREARSTGTTCQDSSLVAVQMHHTMVRTVQYVRYGTHIIPEQKLLTHQRMTFGYSRSSHVQLPLGNGQNNKKRTKIAYRRAPESCFPMAPSAWVSVQHKLPSTIGRPPPISSS